MNFLYLITHDNILIYHNTINIKKLLFLYISSYKKHIEILIKLKYDLIPTIYDTAVLLQNNNNSKCLFHKTQIMYHKLIIFQSLIKFTNYIIPLHKLKKCYLLNNHILNYIYHQHNNHILFINLNILVLRNIHFESHLSHFFLIYSPFILFFVNVFIKSNEFYLFINLYYFFYYFFQVNKNVTRCKKNSITFFFFN